MTGRPRSASDEAIFEAIAAVVTASGPSQLTLAAVAGRVGLSAPALAQRFGSKQGLLAAFAAREAVAVAVALAAARAGGADPVRALVTVLAALPGAVTTRDGLANNLAFLQMDLTDPALRPHAVAHSRALRDGIAALRNRTPSRPACSPRTPFPRRSPPTCGPPTAEPWSRGPSTAPAPCPTGSQRTWNASSPRAGLPRSETAPDPPSE